MPAGNENISFFTRPAWSFKSYPIVPESESKQTLATCTSEGIMARIMTVVLLVRRANRMTSRSHDNGEVEEVIFEFEVRI